MPIISGIFSARCTVTKESFPKFGAEWKSEIKYMEQGGINIVKGKIIRRCSLKLGSLVQHSI